MSNIVILFGFWILFCVWKGLKDPVYLLVLYVSIYFLNPQNRWWGAFLPDVRYAMIAGTLMIISFIMYWGKFRSINPFSFAPYRWYVLIYILLLSIWPIALVPLEHQKNTYIIWKISMRILYNDKSCRFV